MAAPAVFGLLALASIELLFRVLNVHSPASFFTQPPLSRLRDSETDWDLFYQVNSMGLRGPEIATAKPPGMLRVLVIGDSFTFGQGCSEKEIFPAILEARLKNHRPIQVINASNIGLDPEAYYVLSKDVGMRFDPDIVVVNVFGNDTSGIARAPWLNRAVRRLSHQLHLFVLVREARRSMTLRGLRDFWGVVNSRAHTDKQRQAVLEFRKAHGSAQNNLVGACMDPDDVLRWSNPLRDGAAWQEFEGYMRGIRDLCRRKGCKLVIGIVPDGAQVDPAQVAFRRSLGVPMEDAILTEDGKLQSMVCDFAHDLGVSCFDPLGAFRRVRAGLYFPDDLHWTPAGHALYAEALASFLDKNLLLSSPVSPATASRATGVVDSQHR